ncbi:phosphatase PAP2 family protein [Nocardia brevicatena]|uniref:phosphatase PAP2 family protein n=1 Tax=Nocardia brevicatena TaxID=37327 RepID=UPI0002F2624B|nr:phosphatase PAP2 family protein [Nocardia brevicatena]
MGVPSAPTTPGRSPKRRLLRSGIWCGYLVLLAVVTVEFGVPTDRIYQALWIMAGIAAYTPDRPWREHLRILTDWVPLIAALVVYDHSRGVADTLGMPVRVREPAAVEDWLFHDTIPTVWLQQQLMFGDRHPWWTTLTGVVYLSHFILPWLVAAIFYVRSRRRWSRYMRRVLLLSYLGLLTYILLPAAPPWYAAQEGVLAGEVHRVNGFGFVLSSVDIGGEWLEAQGNPVAALPSLHAAFSLLVTVALWPFAKRWWWRAVLVVFPAAMAFTLVYGGEHYVVDVLLGWLYVVLTLVIIGSWERRRDTGTSERAQRTIVRSGPTGRISVESVGSERSW